jgi:Fe-S cluster assembly protein SufD
MEITTQKAMVDAFTANWQSTNLPFNAENISAAKQVLATNDFPSTRVEAWKYTRLTKISKQNFSQDSASIQSIDSFKILKDAQTLVFVNGYFKSDLSSLTSQGNVTVEPIEEASDIELGTNVRLENEVFNAMNTAYAQSGAHIHIGAKTNHEQTIQLLFIQTGKDAVANLRNKIVVEAGAQAKVVMGFFSENAENCFSNVVSEISVGDNARLTIDKLQLENESALQISTEQAEQGRDSYFKINTITLNGLLVRNNVNIDVNGSNSDTHLNGMYLGKGRMHIDNHTVVDHKVPHCESNELYKGVMDENSTAVFNGKVFVRKDAQKINAFQSNGNVLLGNSATVNSKPELEIYADDVKCSHGSTTGQLDEEAVFYLRSRGISETAARKLMISAFIGDVLDKIDDEKILDFVNEKLAELYGWIK